MTVRSSSSLLPHAPVMFREMLAALNPQGGGSYLDGTFGAGGYTRGILESADCKVFAIDRDANVQKFATDLQRKFDGRFVFLSGTFGQMVELLAEQGVASVDGIVLDIGVSSMQIDEAERGFSFRYDGPLDMRMGQQGMTAAELVNEAPEELLADIIYQYGEDRAARRIAKAIVAARAESPIETTRQLADLVARTIGRGKGKIDPATRTFQALRIHVNDELGELVRALEAAEKLLAPGGRLVVITFHSLEDRLVKKFLQLRSGEVESVSRHMPIAAKQKEKSSFSLVERKAVKPTEAECNINARARSAKLRWAVRTDAPPMNISSEKELRHASH